MSDQQQLDWNTLNRTLNEIQRIERVLNSQCTLAARMLVGRLRSVENTYYLKQLKKELRKFNMTTGVWEK